MTLHKILYEYDDAELAEYEEVSEDRAALQNWIEAYLGTVRQVLTAARAEMEIETLPDGKLRVLQKFADVPTLAGRVVEQMMKLWPRRYLPRSAVERLLKNLSKKGDLLQALDAMLNKSEQREKHVEMTIEKTPDGKFHVIKKSRMPEMPEMPEKRFSETIIEPLPDGKFRVINSEK